MHIEVLFWLGVALIIIGGLLMLWSAVNARTAAGVSLTGIWKILKYATMLVNAIGKFIPFYAGRVGFILILVGLFLIFYPMIRGIT
jgi:hypothetical protein